ncbi:unnamed protein product [Arabidopsis thaliana]|uniref:DNA (cytosine-5-)-methyltransferase n=1 Tax=Arabidopsis thaliana TaxID=3702 RepID=A0A7G2F9X0_ARATH|nr:unnamed protein product [Arabidopsis thaliana]
MVEHGDSDDVNWNTDDDELAIDNFQFSPSPVHMSATSPNSIQNRISDETVASFVEMGFSTQMIARAIEETAGANMEPMMILETLFNYSASTEASSSKSKVINHFIAMGFPEEHVIKAMQEHGDEDVGEITNALLTYAEVDKLRESEDMNININDDDDDNLYSLSSDDEEDELNNSSNEDRILQALIKMGYLREDAAIAIERCGEDASMEEVVDFICAAQMARQFDEIYAEPDKKELMNNNKKRRTYTETPRKPNTDQLISLPKEMIGFGVPNHPGLMMHRPVPIPDIARGPPFFYYENVAMTPKGVWAKISSHLYDIVPEFVDSKHFCAAARGISIICQSRIGKNKLAPLDADEMEKLLGFPRDHTRGGGISTTDRYKSLGNSFQVDTVAYHLSVLKPLFPNGINVLSLFTGIGGGEVALHRLQIKMNVVVSVEISDANRNILRSFWEQTNQKGILREFKDVQKLDDNTIERLMDEYGGFDLVIGGSPCNNLAGGNRHHRVGLGGEHSSLFFDYCRILEAVRRKARHMRR